MFHIWNWVSVDSPSWLWLNILSDMLAYVFLFIFESVIVQIPKTNFINFLLKIYLFYLSYKLFYLSYKLYSKTKIN